MATGHIGVGISRSASSHLGQILRQPDALLASRRHSAQRRLAMEAGSGTSLAGSWNSYASGFSAIGKGTMEITEDLVRLSAVVGVEALGSDASRYTRTMVGG